MSESFLSNVWYMALPSAAVPVGGMKGQKIANTPILFMRDGQGKIAAIRDICPHRGIPFSYGRMVGDTVECPYHGWKFNCAGVCTEIPSLLPDQDLDCTKIKVKTYPVQERNGAIWVFIGDKDFDTAKAPALPVLSALAEDAQPDLTFTEIFPCHIDHAVIGLMDPAHGPYVHKSWFWRSEKSMLEKAKRFAPVSHGFQMVRHQPSKNSKAYKIFGGPTTTEITFRLPGVRLEHIQIGDKSFYSLTALAPLDEKNTQIIQMGFWNIPWLFLLKPALSQFGKIFLRQDLEAVRKQQEGLAYDPNLMLLQDADTQAKWYFALKKEWTAHLAEQREFVNPVEETVLRWRS